MEDIRGGVYIQKRRLITTILAEAEDLQKKGINARFVTHDVDEDISKLTDLEVCEQIIALSRKAKELGLHIPLACENPINLGNAIRTRRWKEKHDNRERYNYR